MGLILPNSSLFQRAGITLPKSTEDIAAQLTLGGRGCNIASVKRGVICSDWIVILAYKGEDGGVPFDLRQCSRPHQGGLDEVFVNTA